MKFSRMAVAAALVLGACALDPAQREAGIQQVSSRYRVEVEGQACIDYIRQRLNDPSSLQVVTMPTYNDRITRMFSTLASQDGRAIVTFTGTIRARNAMGGLVLANLLCDFTIKPDGRIVLFDASVGK